MSWGSVSATGQGISFPLHSPHASCFCKPASCCLWRRLPTLSEKSQAKARPWPKPNGSIPQNHATSASARPSQTPREHREAHSQRASHGGHVSCRPWRGAEGLGFFLPVSAC